MPASSQKSHNLVHHGNSLLRRGKLGDNGWWKTHEPAALGAQKAKCILGCIQRSVDRWYKEIIFPFCSCETPPGLLCSVLVKQKKNMELLEQALLRRSWIWYQGRSTSSVNKAWEGWSCSIWRREEVWRPDNTFQYLERAYREVGQGFFYQEL